VIPRDHGLLNRERVEHTEQVINERLCSDRLWRERARAGPAVVICDAPPSGLQTFDKRQPQSPRRDPTTVQHQRRALTEIHRVEMMSLDSQQHAGRILSQPRSKPSGMTIPRFRWIKRQAIRPSPRALINQGVRFAG
jgi:hypothetical protein